MTKFYAALHTVHAHVHASDVHVANGTPIWWSVVALTVHAVANRDNN